MLKIVALFLILLNIIIELSAYVPAHERPNERQELGVIKLRSKRTTKPLIHKHIHQKSRERSYLRSTHGRKFSINPHINDKSIERSDLKSAANKKPVIRKRISDKSVERKELQTTTEEVKTKDVAETSFHVNQCEDAAFMHRDSCKFSSANVAAKFKDHEVVPDVIKQPPKEILQVEYNGIIVELGNVLTPTQAKNMPTLLKWTSEMDALYTLIMIDPDAPSRQDPIFREWRHWLVVNIPGNEVSKGDTLTEYDGPTPPKESGFHRYTILVFKQPGKISDPDYGKLKNWSDDKRYSWTTENFIQKHNLEGPMAGNFYQAEWDRSY